MNPNTRPTLQMIEDSIKSVTYTRLPSGTAIVCEITFNNLHVVHGIATVVDLENHYDDVGKIASYKKAIDEAFKFFAWELHNKMASGKIPNQHGVLMEAYHKLPVAIV